MEDTLFNKHLSVSEGSLNLKDLESALFEETVGTMFPVDKAQMKITSQSMAGLQESSCLGNHRASLLLATIHLSGLGHSVNHEQVQSVPSLYLNYYSIARKAICM